MPREWHDRHAVYKIQDEEKREFYLRIVADKKPYFMRYIYPNLMKDYNEYIKNTNKRALREFAMSVKELMEIPEEERTERQNEFLYYYNDRLPVGNNDCIMNQICRRFEQEFDGYLRRKNKLSKFDYRIMKSGVEYSKKQYNDILMLYEEYHKRLRSFKAFSNYERIDQDTAYGMFADMRDEMFAECVQACPNRFVLCDIVLDICYQKSSTKRFAWEMCGAEIIENLLNKAGGMASFPTQDPDGDIYYGGKRFRLETIEMEVSQDEDCVGRDRVCGEDTGNEGADWS